MNWLCSLHRYCHRNHFYQVAGGGYDNIDSNGLVVTESVTTSFQFYTILSEHVKYSFEARLHGNGTYRASQARRKVGQCQINGYDYFPGLSFRFTGWVVAR